MRQPSLDTPSCRFIPAHKYHHFTHNRVNECKRLLTTVTTQRLGVMTKEGRPDIGRPNLADLRFPLLTRETVKYEPQIMCLKTALHPLRADALALHERIWNF
jgi:hypothetical protein